MERAFMNPTQAAQFAGISRPTLYRWMKIKGFPVYRIGGVTRIATDELTAWIKAQGVTA